MSFGTDLSAQAFYLSELSVGFIDTKRRHWYAAGSVLARRSADTHCLRLVTEIGQRCHVCRTGLQRIGDEGTAARVAVRMEAGRRILSQESEIDDLHSVPDRKDATPRTIVGIAERRVAPKSEIGQVDCVATGKTRDRPAERRRPIEPEGARSAARKGRVLGRCGAEFERPSAGDRCNSGAGDGAVDGKLAPIRAQCPGIGDRAADDEPTGAGRLDGPRVGD